MQKIETTEINGRKTVIYKRPELDDPDIPPLHLIDITDTKYDKVVELMDQNGEKYLLMTERTLGQLLEESK